MNSNLIRTIAAVLTAVVGIAMSLGGCVTNSAGATICSASWLTPQLAGYLVAGLGIAHVVLKLVSGGMKAVVNDVAPIDPSGAKGTVTQAQVNSGSRK